MRKNLLSIFVIPLFAMVISSCTTKQEEKQKLSFAESEYHIHSGERITVEQNYKGVVYAFAGEVPEETEVNSQTGEITFTANTPNYSQVILTASYQELQSDQAVVTLLQNNITTELSFHTPIKNIIDGDYIIVTSLNNSMVINSSIGVSMTSSCSS